MRQRIARRALTRVVWSVGIGGTLLGAGGFLHQKTRQVTGLEGLEIAEGLQATLFAVSPMLASPTNLDVDERGRVWVTEAINYRSDRNPQNPVRTEGDRILILEDTDGDGRADRQKVYYQGRDVDAALGIAVLGNRVFVSAYENVLVFTDTNGDDLPDRKEVLFKLNDRKSDHTVHAFVFGPDGRLYFNMGNASQVVMDPQGKVVVDRAGNPVASKGTPYREGMAFRLEPDGTGFEVLGHNFRNPYEVALDSYGTVWQSDNDDDGYRSVRMNYVMEFGNYGYTDELTGASWSTYRTGMEEEISDRHWHLNDPGVVPSVLHTGAGSPAGLTVYEGDLLPQRFRGALLHTDAGPNVVRAHPVNTVGAGYSAGTINIVKGVKDAWFRPVDVAVAPDGSLLIADWYDPGVGGAGAGDVEHGRILRIAPPGARYVSAKLDLSTPRSAAVALRSPNLSTRYLAYQKLSELGTRAEGALLELWRSAVPRDRARSLWVLARLKGGGPRHVEAALRDPNPDLRITGLRAARRVGMDVIPIARRLVRDPSPAVRREVALALHHHPAPEAAGLWAELAMQHDGRDRWYLEALGIGADRQWDRFFAAWRARVGDDWNTPAGRDLVWRARTDAALPILGSLIRDPATDERQRARYFRAFDFHRSPLREEVLAGLLQGAHPEQSRITALALTHLDPKAVAGSPALRSAVGATLDAVRGTPSFVELAAKYDVRDRTADLVALALKEPETTLGVQAARLVVRWGGIDHFGRALADGQTAPRVLRVLGFAGGSEAERLIQEIILDDRRPVAVRQGAVLALGQSLSGEKLLLPLVEKGLLPESLKPAAATVLFASHRNTIREAALKYLPAPTAATRDGKTLRAIGMLAAQEGDPARGEAAFARACASCHVARGAGREFGPALTEIGDKLPREALYKAILHPSDGISFGYEGHTLRLRDGTEVVGIVTSETRDEIAVRFPGGVTNRYPRASVADRVPLERSLMPDGLERAFTEEELIDLVEYLTTLKKPAR